MTEETASSQKVESQVEFESPYKRWVTELAAANTRVKRWHKQGNRIEARWQDRRGQEEKEFAQDDTQYAFRVNLFHSNVASQRDMIYGNIPKVEVSRKYADPDDDQARVASSILSRILNNSVEVSGDDLKSTLGHCLLDRLLPGLGLARIRYDFESEEEEIPPLLNPNGDELAPGYTQENLLSEDFPIEYIHWDDFRWGWARTWSEVPWIAFRSYLNKDQVKKRFGDDVAEGVTYKNKSVKTTIEKKMSSDEITDAWDKAEIWEIWDKNDKKVCWISIGYEELMDSKEDPLKLRGFWPMPEPLIANATTSLFLPQPDFVIAQDLYNQIDQIETRISIITTAIRVVGVYDSAEEGIKRMLQEGMENELIPVKNWAAFAEGGGLDGKVQWMPVGEIAAVLSELVGQRTDAMSLLYEVTGMSEIMRGANGPDRETAEASSSKRQFASVRVQGLSEDFARFTTDLMALRAEVISKHFDPQTIAKQSNILRSLDAPIAEQAIALIKDPEDLMWRIKVNSESMAMLDYQALKKDRIDWITALAQFMQSAFPLVEMDKSAVPPLLQILKWTMAGFKGSNEIEGVLDRAIEQMMKMPKEDSKEPSPEQLKMQADAQKHQQAMELQALKHQQTMQSEMIKFQNSVKELRAELKKELQIIRAEMEADIRTEAAQSEAAMIQDDHETANQMKLAGMKDNGSGEGESASTD